ncbi:imm11 family protein [Vibrio parahaemolyticus]|uniref:imm11 family protein n=1 Tax=Vibrio parahaemolyticus TaxID=670 RepID=UPI00320D3600
MTLKIWTNKVERDSDFTQGKVTEPSVLRGLNLTGGVVLGDKWPSVTIDVISDDKPADSFLSGPLLIVSRRLADLISEHTQTSEVEFLPIEVNYHGKNFGEYCFLNVLAICDLLDRNHSIFSEFDGEIDSIDRVVLKKDIETQKTIFQLDAIEWLLCVDEKLAELIENKGFSGVAFQSESEWRPF